MITENDLLEAIAECQGDRNPNANTCIKLAAYYILLDHLKPKEEDEPVMYSYDSGIGDYGSDTEFGRLIRGIDHQKMIFSLNIQLINSLFHHTEAQEILEYKKELLNQLILLLIFLDMLYLDGISLFQIFSLFPCSFQ